MSGTASSSNISRRQRRNRAASARKWPSHHSWRQTKPSHATTSLPAPSTQAAQALLSAVTGSTILPDQLGQTNHHAYVNSLQQLVDTYGTAHVNLVLYGPEGGTTSNEQLSNGVFELMSQLAVFARNDNQFTIDEACSSLLEHNAVATIGDEDMRRDRLRQLVFAAFGWASGIYSALAPTDATMHYLRTKSQGLEEIQATEPISRCSRPFSELLGSICSSLLPLSSLEAEKFELAAQPSQLKEEDKPSSEAFIVDHLNAATLQTIGGIRFQWVTNLAEHLTFDLLGKTLKLYRLPTTCLLQLDPNSLASLLLDGIYNALDRPSGFTASKLLREVILSLQLMFGEEKKSRKLYQYQESRALLMNGHRDPTLQVICRNASARESDHEWNELTRTRSFDKAQHFPILTPKLAPLQDYMLRQQPNHLMGLWTDRRDKLKWYTFWAVIVVGGLSVLLGVLQVILAAIQVAVSYRSLECGCRQA